MGERPFEMKESVKEYLLELKARQEVDAQLNEVDAKLAADNELKKKEMNENLKFDVDAAERDAKAEEEKESKTEKEEDKGEDKKKE